MDDDKLASSPKSSRCKLPKQSSSAVLFGRLLSSIVLRTPEIASHASMSNMWDVDRCRYTTHYTH